MERKVVEIKVAKKGVLARSCTLCGKPLKYIITLGNTRYSSTTSLCDECLNDLVHEIDKIKRTEMTIEGIMYMSNKLGRSDLTIDSVSEMSIEEIKKIHTELLKEVLKGSDYNGK